MVSTRASVDDINLGLRPIHSLEKRARSSSPVKQRRPTQDWASLARSDDGSLDRLFSTTALSHDQLMRLSKSDKSERLHISKSDYAIPIPFQIQFPPRLAKKLSPSVSPIANKTPKLVFTGHSYEPIAPEMSTSFDKTSKISRPTSPVKPPSVIDNRKKVSAFVKLALLDYLDQLSMIEEKSNSSNSRSSSYKSKELPSIPAEISEASYGKPREVVTKESPKTPIASPLPKRGISTPNTFTVKPRKVPPCDDESVEYKKPSINSHPMELHSQLATPATPATPVRPTQLQKKLPDTITTPEAPTISSELKTLPSRLPNSLGFQHNLSMINQPELKIDRRTFSNESHVSSVSSFSSVGDMFNFNHAYMLSPNAKGEVRVSKQLADLMLEGDSKKQILDPPIEQEYENVTHVSELNGSPYKSLQPVKNGKNETEPKKSNLDLETLSLGVNGHELEPKRVESPQDAINHVANSGKGEHYSETAPLVIQRREKEEQTCPDDNVGAGIGFHFPNNNSNATNNSEAKKRTEQRQRTRRSSRTSFFSDGKIEIPDLDDDSFWKTRFHDNAKPQSETQIEPIGLPSSGAKEHLKTILGDGSFDSDSDSSFNSQFSKLQSKPEEKMSLPPSKSLGTISSMSSPVRHARHRSMCNIDFDYQSVAKPAQNHHTRSKSNVSASTYTSSFADLGLPKKSYHARRTSYQGNSRNSFKIPEHEKIAEDFENLDIKVNEPPKKVSYAVDFKAGDSIPDSTPIFHIQGPSQDYYQNFKKSTKPISNASSGHYKTEESDASSSYRSSKTGRDTESTAPTENDNILIDLTKEKYDVCMVSRNDSTTSYKSTIEKTKDGKNVEVVLVEEDEDFDDRDDLLSIYSRYMNNWGDKSGYRAQQQYSTSLPSSTGLSRKSSTRSEISEASDALGQSWGASSESNFQVKSLASVKREQAYKPKLVPVDEKVCAGKIKGNPIMSRNSFNARPDASYFDYSVNESYDFKSFMSQQAQR